MSSDSTSKEQRILVVMRKVLANIVKDITPDPGMRNPLSESTIRDIRECFGLISARERELTEERGVEITDRPHYPDQPQSSKVISLASLKKKPPKE